MLIGKKIIDNKEYVIFHKKIFLAIIILIFILASWLFYNNLFFLSTMKSKNSYFSKQYKNIVLKNKFKQQKGENLSTLRDTLLGLKKCI